MFELYRRNFQSISLKKMIILLVGIAIPSVGIYSTMTVTSSYLAINNSSASSLSNITMFGVYQGIQGGGETRSYVDNVASQGLKWDADCICTGLNATSYGWLTTAGINLNELIWVNPTGYTESSYKSWVTSVVTELPTVHQWEYGQEIQQYWNNISPQAYLQGLVWAYQAITSIPGHSSDVFMGPEETGLLSSGVWGGYDGCSTTRCVDGWDGTANDKIGWFYTFWHSSYTDPSTGIAYTPSRILNYVSVDVFTQNQLFDSVLATGPYSGKTIQKEMTDAINLWFNIEGGVRPIVVLATGFPSDLGCGESCQATWYQQAIPFYESFGYIKGVFAYSLYDTQSTLWGLYTSNFTPKPAWSVYQSNFASSSGSATTSSFSASTSSSIPTTTISSSSTTKNSTAISSASTSSSSSTTDSSSASSSAYSSQSSQSSPDSSSSNASASSASYTSSNSSSASSSALSSSMKGHYGGGQGQENGLKDINSNSPTTIRSMEGILATLSPAKNPPVAYGLATYELLMIGALGFVIRGVQKEWREIRISISKWRW